MSADATWVELQLDLPEAATELVAAAVAEIAGGVEIRDPRTLIAAPQGRAVVVALVAPGDVDQVLAVVDETCALARSQGVALDPVLVRRREAHEDEWRDVWKQYFRAVRVGRRFLVRPSWDLAPAAPHDRVIDIDPGRAFGTGGHASTRLAMMIAEDLHDAGGAVSRFLDLGCGSGILSIAAALLWPEARGLAVDNDPEATGCTHENLERNGLGTVEIATGTLEDAPGPYDLILANIQADVLAPLARGVKQRLAPGGHAVLSGLLVEDVDRVLERYRAVGLDVRARQVEGEWAALLVAAPEPRGRSG